MDFASPRYVYFVGAGRGDGWARGRTSRLRGDASRKTAGRFRVLVRVADGDAAYWSTYFEAFPLRLTSWRAAPTWT